MARIQWRRGFAADWTEVNPILYSGEAGLELDTGRFKLGDGATPWNGLEYNETPNDSITAIKVQERGITPDKLILPDQNGILVDIDFSLYPDSDTLPDPLIDIGIEGGPYELEQDQMGIRDGYLTQITTRGDNYSYPLGPGVTTGWRAACYVETGHANVRITTWQTLENYLSQTGGPLGACVPEDPHLGVGTWIVNLISWFELGEIGRNAADLVYTDPTFWDHAELPPDEVRVDLYIYEGWYWVFTDGVHSNGPVELPDELKGSTKHGAQTDFLSGGPVPEPAGIPCISRLQIAVYDGPEPLEYPAPTVTCGAATKGAGVTTRTPAIPDGAAIGDVLLMWVGGTQVPTTPSGWTIVETSSVTGATSRILQHVVDGTEPWFGLTSQTLTVTFPSGDVFAEITKLTQPNPRLPMLSTPRLNTTASVNAPTNQAQVLGPHRSGLIAVTVPADVTVTWPSGFTQQTITAAGGAAMTFALARCPDWSADSAPDMVRMLSGNTLHTPAGLQATLSSSARSIVQNVIIFPNPAEAEV